MSDQDRNRSNILQIFMLNYTGGQFRRFETIC